MRVVDNRAWLEWLVDLHARPQSPAKKCPPRRPGSCPRSSPMNWRTGSPERSRTRRRAGDRLFQRTGLVKPLDTAPSRYAPPRSPGTIRSPMADAIILRDRRSTPGARTRSTCDAHFANLPVGSFISPRAPSMTAPPRRLVSAEKRPEDDAALAPASACRFRRPGGGAQEPQGVHRKARRRAARRSITCCSSAPRPRQDDPGADRRARARRQLSFDLGARDRQGGRPRRAAHQSRAARRAVHRRD